ncbi:MAG: Regulatory protein RecX [Firmicutes bacterium ADurb.Bin248]|nr:MAG: Regulatory protein RecX [Firmicutes bacterium ADurb.Bin248]HOG00010.1 RecX family transcriptional regulator [Clostridia bacterium]HPK14487.1 RecX family transcriptional regulator [Clostridia bacterium]
MAKRDASPMDAALAYLAAKPRTAREVAQKLDSLEFGEGDVDQTVARLAELGLVDDARYAEEFVASRLATKPVSRAKLRGQLYSHRLAAEHVEAALAAVDDAAEAENALLVAGKYARRFAELEEEERKRRVMRRLVGRGFSFGASKAAIEKLFGDAQGLEDAAEDGDDGED